MYEASLIAKCDDVGEDGEDGEVDEVGEVDEDGGSEKVRQLL